MSSALSTADVSAIREAAAGLLWDSGVLLRYSTASSGGYQTANYGDYDDEHESLEVTTECNVKFDGARDIEDWTELAQGTGTLKLPVSLEGTVTKEDRFRWTHKLGTALEKTIELAIVGVPRVEMMFLVCDFTVLPSGVEAAT